MQAITTKFMPATSHKPSRIKARCQAKSKIISWDHDLDVYENHKRAAFLLADELKWAGLWIGGGLPDVIGYAFVMVPADYRDALRVY